MKTLRLGSFALVLAACSAGIPASADTLQAPESPVLLSTAQPWTDAQIEQLVGPIALYPDILVGLILPAATEPSDIVLAARYLAAGGSQEGIEAQPWDDAVQGLAHYPEVIAWMDSGLVWTRQLGEVFSAQPKEVLQGIQTQRRRALAAGTLTSTAQQQVVVEGNEIRILPARSDVIYVPRYDPVIVYRSGYYSAGYSTALVFGTGYPVGYWLAYDCDWTDRRVWYVAPSVRITVWRDRPDWRYRRPEPTGPHWHAWSRGPGGRPSHRDFDDHRGPSAPSHPTRPGNNRPREVITPRETPPAWHNDSSRDRRRPTPGMNNDRRGGDTPPTVGSPNAGREFNNPDDRRPRTPAVNPPSTPTENRRTTPPRVAPVDTDRSSPPPQTWRGESRPGKGRVQSDEPRREAEQPRYAPEPPRETPRAAPDPAPARMAPPQERSTEREKPDKRQTSPIEP